MKGKDLGKFSLVDDEDFELAMQYTWHINTHGYAMANKQCRNKMTRFLLHRLVMRAPSDKMVDHINHDRLDNRKSNLRLCSRAENMANQRLLDANTSGYKGVCWETRTKKWKVQISVNGITRHLGRFTDKIKAARHYDKHARLLKGEFALCNFEKV